jgi:hypothetical protein
VCVCGWVCVVNSHKYAKRSSTQPFQQSKAVKQVFMYAGVHMCIVRTCIQIRPSFLIVEQVFLSTLIYTCNKALTSQSYIVHSTAGVHIYIDIHM